MSQVTKSFWKGNREYRLLGLKVFEVTENFSSYDGDGEFITETIPNKEYFEKEFLSRRNRNL